MAVSLGNKTAALMGYDYPGNVRELLNVLERAVVLPATRSASTYERTNHYLLLQIIHEEWYNLSRKQLFRKWLFQN